MIKFKIRTRKNLTFLGLAFSGEKLPKAKGGEAFYDNDEKNEIDNIYFLNSDYFFELLKFIDLNIKNFPSNDYRELFETLKNYEEINEENIDFGKLEHYTYTEPNFEKRELDIKILDNISERNSTFYEDMKRLYKGYQVTYWGSKNTVVIIFEFNHEKEFIFNLKPIITLLNGHNLSLETFNIYRDPRRRLNNVKIVVK